MRKGAYSNKFKALEAEKVNELKEDHRSVLLLHKEQERNLIRETNRRRKHIAEKKQSLAESELNRRQKVLAARRKRQFEATSKFQRSPVNKFKRNEENENPDPFGLRDGVYNIRGHIVEIKDGKRISSHDTVSPMRNNTGSQGKKINDSAVRYDSRSKNTIYSGKEYLLNHVSDLVHGREDRKSRDEKTSSSERENEVKDTESECPINPTEGNFQGRVNDVATHDEIKDQSFAVPMAQRNAETISKTHSSDASLSSTDSLDFSNDSKSDKVTRAPKSSLKRGKTPKSCNKGKRKVKFNSSIEFNDGFVWMLKDNEQKPASAIVTNSTAIVTNELPSASLSEEKQKLQTDIQLNTAPLHGNIVSRNEDYSYPESVDLALAPRSYAIKRGKEEGTSESDKNDETLGEEKVKNGFDNYNLYDSLDGDRALKDQWSHKGSGVEVGRKDSLEVEAFMEPKPQINREGISEEWSSQSERMNAIQLESPANGFSGIEQRDIQQHRRIQQATWSQGFNDRQSLGQYTRQHEYESRKAAARQNNNAVIGEKNYGSQQEVDHTSRLHDMMGVTTTTDNLKNNQEYPAYSPYSDRNSFLRNDDKGHDNLTGFAPTDNHKNALADSVIAHLRSDAVEQYANTQGDISQHRPFYPLPQHTTAYLSGGTTKGFDNYPNSSTQFPRSTVQLADKTHFDSGKRNKPATNVHLQKQHEEQRGALLGHSRGHVHEEELTNLQRYYKGQEAAIQNHAIGVSQRGALLGHSPHVPIPHEEQLTNAHRHYQRQEIAIPNNAIVVTQESPYINENSGKLVNAVDSLSRTNNMPSNTFKFDSTPRLATDVATTSSDKTFINMHGAPSSYENNASVSGAPLPHSVTTSTNHGMAFNRRTKNPENAGSDDEDEVISNVRKSMAELQFSTNWRPTSSIVEGRDEKVSSAKQYMEELPRPSNKAKTSEPDVVDNGDEIKQQSKIEETPNRKSNIPVRVGSATKSELFGPNSSMRAPQKGGIVPHPPQGTKGLFTRKHSRNESANRRNSPMRVVNPHVSKNQGSPTNETRRNVAANISNAPIGSNTRPDDYYDGKGPRLDLAKRDIVEQQRKHYYQSEMPNGITQLDSNRRLSAENNRNENLNKTPTDDEINELWYNVRHCLTTKPPPKASSDSMYVVPPWRQNRTWSGSRNGRPQRRQLSLHTMPANKQRPDLPLRRYGSHENLLRRDNSLENLVAPARNRVRSALLPQRSNKEKISTNFQAFSAKKQPRSLPTESEGSPNISEPQASKRKPKDMSESLASFLALEAMCQQESLSPQRTSAVLKASQNVYKELLNERLNEEPVQYYASARRQEPSALSIEERKIMESLERLNSRLREKDAEQQKTEATTRWTQPAFNEINRGTRRIASGNSSKTSGIGSRAEMYGIQNSAHRY